MEDKKWDLAALASIPLIMTLGNSMLIPILPQISQQLHVSAFQVSMLITVYAVVAILLIPIAGYLSDRFGRKTVIIPSLIIAAAGGALSGVAAWMTDGLAAYWIILGGRFLQGIGAAGAFPIVLPLVGDMFKEEDDVSKSLGIIETSNTFGKVLSPILGAALASVLWYLPFLSIPVLCVISLLLVLFFVKTPKKKNKNDNSIRQFLSDTKSILKEKGRWLYAIFTVGGISMFILFGVLFYLSETLESKYGLHGVIKGLVLAIPLAVLCLASFVAGKIIGKNKKRMKWTGFIGMALLTIGLVITGFSSQIYFVVTFFSLCGAGIGTALPCMDALITEGIEQKQRGTITSLYSSMRFIGVSLGPPAVSLLMKTNHWVLFGIMAVIGAVGGLLTLFAVKPDENKTDKPTEHKAKPQAGILMKRAKAR
ncbi:multidrug resistance protein [Paenibacillus sp. J23TS9]|uniref:MFS transporter n=1 Tax=Paenibacillus sp. J23TS9 TaxID=2807193 RepID=UPI001B0F9D6B|nr:MFS transporter [Paenibacillus sp. J23TS9]GIP27497.1 multidrug resistance protein [Paenibacillus sp. J23TS9]